jgi:hypothetical protein
MSKRMLLCSIAAVAGFSAVAFGQEMVPNWPAPELWNPPVRVAASEGRAGVGIEAVEVVEVVEAVPTSPLHFVGITPCRLADTRGNGFTGQYGPPSLTPSGRNMVITGQCGIPGDAQAVSFNFSAINVPAAGFLVAYPAGGIFPPVATMVYNQNTPNLSNAAVVPLGTGGAITVVAAVTTIDLVVDVNGYYRPGVVTAVNGLSGNVTLAAGSNVTITPSGQTLTVAASGGPGGVLPTGTLNQTLRHNGTSWVASGALTNDGTDVSVTGPLTLSNGVLLLRRSDFTLFHICCNTNNTFLGISAGNLTNTGAFNTAIGTFALSQLTSGASNTAVGANSLDVNTSGSSNTALGAVSLLRNVFGANNTAVGASALTNNMTGSGNIALGYFAGSTNTGGSGNIFIGNNVGATTTGSNNIYIASAPAGNESNQIRIGRNDVHTQGTVIASIYGFGSGGGIPVIVNAGGRLGTTTSSVRYKDDVRDIGAESEGLMDLRPVVFKYKPEFDSSGLRQYGLIAEEVAEIYPELVVYDAEGRPETIRYQLLDALLLNEVQKQRVEIDALKAQFARLAERLDTKPQP